MSEENVTIGARIPARTRAIILEEAARRNLHFTEVAGEKILAGIEAERFNKEKQNDKPN